jgi:hypothetical protein
MIRVLAPVGIGAAQLFSAVKSRFPPIASSR